MDFNLTATCVSKLTDCRAGNAFWDFFSPYSELCRSLYVNHALDF